jgi:UDP-N-acetylglucosamine diphosphorylase / glucose-1-phosphate thymidylyltransferase / UDP-N-acetylgalactosamine diphosphorylase / glucosamine-1-phosphate N-acetyltransferase / galactosamine-1-phosphate N-acetyltransferase
MQVIIPMAGLGSRFADVGIRLPKPLIPVLGKTLIEHSIKSFDVDAEFIFVTREFDDAQHNQQLSELLTQLRPESKEVRLKAVTMGASQTCLAAQHLLRPDESLVIYNCDQILRWDPQDFVQFVQQRQPQGAVVLYHSSDAKNSFALLDEKKTVTRIAEKEVISNNALVGFHYWQRSKYFIQSAQALLHEFRNSGRPECYVSETYNHMIADDHTVLPYFVSNHMYIPLGTPQDVARHVGQTREFDNSKPKTIFCDIDGTILRHAHRISDVLQGKPEVLAGVIDKFNEWDSQGHTIILTTARKESARAITEQHLVQCGIVYDQLIMGISSGVRYLFNDKRGSRDADRAVAVNVVTDQGFDLVDWKALGL